jgi:uncharacterized ion transporter superfamily protein YfcC
MTNPAVKTFISAIAILLILLLGTGLLTYLIPNGVFNMDTGVFTQFSQSGISIVKLIFSPFLVLLSDSGVMIISIILFLFIIAGSIHVMKSTGLIENVINDTIKKYQKKETVLQAVLILFFMSLGAFVGVFEEIVPLVPLIIMLSRSMGWDELTGLSLSVLATGVGFASAVTNPFTIGVAQQLADVPVFSGAVFRVLIFITTYIIYLYMVLRRSKKIRVEANESANLNVVSKSIKSMPFFISMMSLMLLTILSTTFISTIRDLSLPIIAIVFLIIGIGVGKIENGSLKWTFHVFFEGVKEMLPAIILVLLASSIKYVMVEGNILDTVLYYSSIALESTSSFGGILFSFIIVMILNFFIGSGSAKAFILMPILMPLMDMIGVSRQLGILAFQFGDGFSNVLYPTNAVLLISLGLAKISYSKWLKFVLPIQFVLFIVSIIFLYFGYKIGYGL